jgi:hypothetical protein
MSALPALVLFAHVLFAKPLATPHQVRGLLLRDMLWPGAATVCAGPA